MWVITLTEYFLRYGGWFFALLGCLVLAWWLWGVRYSREWHEPLTEREGDFL